MKRIYLISFLILVIIGSFACMGIFGGGVEVATLHIEVEDISASSDDYSGGSLLIDPDYSLRTFHVTYSYYSSEPITEGGSNVVKTDGTVGGEFFDRFEEIVEWLDDQEPLSTDVTGEGNVQVMVFPTEGEESAKDYSFSWEEDVEGIDDLQLFYFDIVTLFTEDTY